MYIKVSKTLSTKYYQENKERLVKDKQKLVKDIIFFNEKKKSDNMVVNDTKISQKMKNKSLLSI